LRLDFGSHRLCPPIHSFFLFAILYLFPVLRIRLRRAGTSCLAEVALLMQSRFRLSRRRHLSLNFNRIARCLWLRYRVLELQASLLSCSTSAIASCGLWACAANKGPRVTGDSAVISVKPPSSVGLIRSRLPMGQHFQTYPSGI
jgi:hypothetical protein